MKQCEMVVDRLLKIADDVARKTRNPAHAKIESDILKTAADAAFRQSQHQRLQRRTPKVKFFDLEINTEEQSMEQKVSAAARTLAKSKKIATS